MTHVLKENRTALQIVKLPEPSRNWPWPSQCVVFLGKTLYSAHASPHPGVSVGTGKLSGKPHKMLGGSLAMD